MLRGSIHRWLSVFSLVALTACGGEDDNSFNAPGDNPTPPMFSPAYFAWMQADIQSAWADGFFGQGTRLTVVDDFQGDLAILGDLGLGRETKSHGDWVAQHVELLAPGTDLAQQDVAIAAPITLSAGKLNVINLSYGTPDLFDAERVIDWGPRETSILSHADGAAVVVKAAGNEQISVGGVAGDDLDYLSRDLIGKPTAIFVGALDRHGTPSNRASLATYSNFAGSDLRVQEQFLVVGVSGGLLNESGTNLQGTSFAAPQVSSYAAILGSKFTGASAQQITDQLLDTARTDTIQGYNVSVHGQGEASLFRALAPISIQ